MDRVPPFWSERDGLSFMFKKLLGPHWRLPCHSTVNRHQQDLLQSLRGRVSDLVRATCNQNPGYGILTVSHDLWQAPDNLHYQCQILHFIDADLVRRRILYYVDKLGVQKTSANQATRIKAVWNERGWDHKQMAVCISDCTASARNVAADMGVQGALCGAHITALEPRRQVFKVPRQTDGVQTLQVHEDALPEVVEHMEAVRARAKLYRFTEAKRQEMDNVQKFLADTKPKRVLIDSSAKWSCTVEMLEREFTLRAAYLELKARHPSCRELPASLDTFTASRDIAGVLRPFQLCTNLLQGGAACASVVLPCFKALESQLQAAEPVYVQADTAPTLKPLQEEHLHTLARALRDRLHSQLAKENQHLEWQRPVLLKCTLLDPRFRLRNGTVQEREGTVSALYDEGARLLSAERPEEAPIAQAVSPRRQMKRSFLAMMDGEPTVDAADESSLRRQERQALKRQLSSYMHGANIEKDADPLEWWREHRHEFHHMLPLVKKYLAVPASTADAERIFSLAKAFLADNRQRAEAMSDALELSLGLSLLDLQL